MRILSLVKFQLVDRQSLNSTLYDPLKCSSAGVVIEAKTSFCSDDGRVQLGVHIGEWHRIMRDLTHLDQFLITIPMVLVVGSDWKLYYA